MWVNERKQSGGLFSRSGVAQNKEPEAWGTTHTPGDYVTATGTVNKQSTGNRGLDAPRRETK